MYLQLRVQKRRRGTFLGNTRVPGLGPLPEHPSSIEFQSSIIEKREWAHRMGVVPQDWDHLAMWIHLELDE